MGISDDGQASTYFFPDRQVHKVSRGSIRGLRGPLFCGFFQRFVDPAHLLPFSVVLTKVLAIKSELHRVSCSRSTLSVPMRPHIETWDRCQNWQLHAKLHIALRVHCLVADS